MVIDPAQGLMPLFGDGELVTLPNKGSYLKVSCSHYRDGEWLYSGAVHVVRHGELHDKQEYLKDIPESSLGPIPRLPPRRC